MNKQLFKKALSLVVAIFLAIGSVCVMPATEVSAAAAPKKITLNAKNKTIGVGQTFKLKVKSVTPKKASKKVSFKSSNKKVAKVTSSGSVKGLKAGTAKITVTSKAKKTVKATCKVTVAAINVSNAKSGVLSVEVNKSVTVKPSMQPKSVKTAGYTYSMKDKKIATVTSGGKVTGVKAGKTTLTIKSKKKKKSDPTYTLKLTVKVSGSAQKPDNNKPDDNKPDDNKPDDNKPDNEEPDVDDPAAIKRWKFDFGSATDVAEGYTAVTADKDFWSENNTDGYGFMGINKESSRASNRYDGFGNQLGQVQVLQTGGGTGIKDAIGCVGIQGPKDELGDEYYPTRFALRVPDDTYYKVTATVTTLDPAKNATATLYTERKHPIYTDKTIQAGKTVKSVFTIRVTPIYYEKSDPKGLIADGMVNVCVAGDNTALAALKIEQIKTAPTLWVLGDSTVTDGNTTLPFFRLQNYTGVGTGLTQYLPRNIAMVNEGEGGLNAADANHFDVVKDRIKQGDWLYVEYGHNHDSESEYTNCLNKYYEACEKVGANLLIVSPIERINHFSGGVYQHSLEGYARAGEAYVNEKINAGKKNIAFVDLNKTSYEFYNKITKDNGGDANAIKFYFCTELGGKTDTTHPNDAGAENLAYCFFEAAKAVTDETQKAVLSGLLDGMSEEQPHLISKAITDLGPAPNKAWPEYTLPIDEEYPVAIKNIRFDEDGKLSYVKVKVQQAKTTMSSYGIVAVTISNASGSVKGVLYANDQVDNSTGYGSQTISSFRSEGGGNVTLADGDTYSIVVYKAHRNEENVLVKDDPEVAYSRVYTEDNMSYIEEYLLPGETSDVEDFDHFTQTTLTGSGKWLFGGSSGCDLSLGEDADGKTYTNLKVTSATGSWVVAREFENLTEKNVNVGTGKSGSYMIDADLKYISGANLKFSFVERTKNRFQAPFIEGAILDAFVIGTGGEVTSHGTKLAAKLAQNQWTHITYVLNMDAGTAEITIGSNAPQTVKVPEYATYGEVAIETFRHLSITQTANRSSFSVQLSDLTVAKLRDTGAQAEVKASVTGTGKVKINDKEIGQTNVPLASQVTLEAVPTGESAFNGWYMGTELYSTQRKISLRAYQNVNLEAKFIVGKKTNVTVNYKDKDGTVIKQASTITEADGISLFEGQSFALDDSYLEQLAIKDGTLTKLYLYNSQKSSATTIASMKAEGSNVIDLVFDLDGIYDEFEDFNSSELTPANWGFTAGTSGNVAWKDGTLRLFINATQGKETPDKKEFSAGIAAARKLTVRFEWINDVEYGKGRSSSFNLNDSNGNVIFSLFAQGNRGVFCDVNRVAAETSTKVSGDSRDWTRVKLTIDFAAKKISGTIVNLTTGAETAIPETALTDAANLATLTTKYGYTVAPQRLDNFGIRYTAE